MEDIRQEGNGYKKKNNFQVDLTFFQIIAYPIAKSLYHFPDLKPVKDFLYNRTQLQHNVFSAILPNSCFKDSERRSGRVNCD